VVTVRYVQKPLKKYENHTLTLKYCVMNVEEQTLFSPVIYVVPLTHYIRDQDSLLRQDHHTKS
jgi:hypothetical protein